MSKLPDLEAWAIFATVARAGSFARAAQELALSQATVSKAVSRLEARMKVGLFHRTSRHMSLTDSGLQVLERATRLLEEGQTVESELSEHSVTLRGLVRVAVPMSFGLSHVAPALPDFMAQHPEVTLEVEFNDELVDLIERRFDLAVRISTLPDSSLLSRRLCTVKVLLVGAPLYFERHGRPRHPRDLAHHRALRYAHSHQGSNWHFKHARQGEFVQAMPMALGVNNAEGLMPALKAGLGLALQPEFLVWHELRAGLLETALPDWQVDPIALHVVTPPGRLRPARVKALMDYLVEHFTSSAWARDPTALDDTVHEPPARTRVRRARQASADR